MGERKTRKRESLGTGRASMHTVRWNPSFFAWSLEPIVTGRRIGTLTSTKQSFAHAGDRGRGRDMKVTLVRPFHSNAENTVAWLSSGPTAWRRLASWGCVARS